MTLQQQLKQSAKRNNKYGAKRVQVDGYWFDSKAEAKRYGELKLQIKAGLISELQIHPRYNIPGTAFDGIPPICTVELDFQYWEHEGLRYVYEDVKGKDNPLSQLKRKLVDAFYGIKVEVIK